MTVSMALAKSLQLSGVSWCFGEDKDGDSAIRDEMTVLIIRTESFRADKVLSMYTVCHAEAELARQFDISWMTLFSCLRSL